MNQMKQTVHSAAVARSSSGRSGPLLFWVVFFFFSSTLPLSYFGNLVAVDWGVKRWGHMMCLNMYKCTWSKWQLSHKLQHERKRSAITIRLLQF